MANKYFDITLNYEKTVWMILSDNIRETRGLVEYSDKMMHLLREAFYKVEGSA